MDKKTFLIQLWDALDNFNDAAKKLNGAWTEDIDLGNEFASGEDYPFRESFELIESRISNWTDAAKLKIALETYEGKK